MSQLLWSPTGEEVTAHTEEEAQAYLARGYRETAAPQPEAVKASEKTPDTHSAVKHSTTSKADTHKKK